MKLVGQLTKEFFGGEVWVLRTDDGATYQLSGSIPSKLENRRVRVSARPSEASFGFSMVGQILDVRRIAEA
ncbi:MAG: hypothetical protein H6739_04140 [Alphaproteobacteria bacterium]|nr:hypothetical protein [Alphaproteobacteria bacterium]